MLVDGDASYKAFRELNTDIAKQNRDVLSQSGGRPFAALAAEKWLQLHVVGQPNETKHVAAINRGFIEHTGAAIWTAGVAPDDELVPMLNQYCFRCHSSVRYHVFQKSEVIAKRDGDTGIVERVKSGNMPQDRTLDEGTRKRLVALVESLKK